MMKIMRNCLVAAFGLLLLANNSFGLNWTNQFGGDLMAGVNWTGGIAPVAGDTLDHYSAVSYWGTGQNPTPMSFTLSSDLVATKWNQAFGRRQYDINLSSFNITLSSSWDLTQSNQNSSNNITGAGTVTASHFLVGGGATSVTRLNVYGSTTKVATTASGSDTIIDGIKNSSVLGGAGGWIRLYSGATWTNAAHMVLVNSASTTSHAGLFVSDSGTVLNVNDTRSIFVGYRGMGSFIATNNAIVNATTLSVGSGSWNNDNISAVGFADISGGATLNANKSGYGLEVGRFTTGTVTVASGGVVNANRVVVGKGNNDALVRLTANGTLTVTGTGSKVLSTGFANIGELVRGEVSVLAGGKFAATDLTLGKGYAAVIGGNTTNAPAYGLLTVSNANSFVEVKSLTIGSEGTAKVVVADDGKLSTTGTTALGFISLKNSSLVIQDAEVTATGGLTTSGTSALDIELGAKAHGLYYMTLTGSMALVGTTALNITVAGDFTASNGDTIKLIDYASKSGTFSNIDNGDTFITGGKEFQLTYGDGDTYLTVIPEPASVLLMVSGLVAAWKLRRRA
jgi:T5SS/PEP-CTERM-associated repeat protein